VLSLKKVKDKDLGYFFVLPACVMLVIVLVFPAINTLLYSLTPKGSVVGSEYTLGNYVRVLQDKVFWGTFGNTAIFVSSSVALHLMLGLCVALLLNVRLRGRIFFRIIALLPWTVPDVVSGIVWKWMYNPLHGCLNDLLFRLNVIDSHAMWLSDPTWALPSLIITNLWRGYPFVMIILLAGLQAIPTQLYEAASIDGASGLQKFRYVTLPGLNKMFLVALALDTVWEFRRFALVKVMTEGGPGHATEVLSTLVYKQYFRFFQFEYASAIAILMSGVIMLFSMPYVLMIVKGE